VVAVPLQRAADDLMLHFDVVQSASVPQALCGGLSHVPPAVQVCDSVTVQATKFGLPQVE
jgi:hypothetical protein